MNMKNDFPRSPTGAFVKASRMAERRKVSLRDFCEAAGCSPSAVYRWRTNSRTYDVSVLVKLCNYFDATRKTRKLKCRPFLD